MDLGLEDYAWGLQTARDMKQGRERGTEGPVLREAEKFRECSLFPFTN